MLALQRTVLAACAFLALSSAAAPIAPKLTQQQLLWMNSHDEGNNGGQIPWYILAAVKEGMALPETKTGKAAESGASAGRESGDTTRPKAGGGFVSPNGSVEVAGAVGMDAGLDAGHHF
ncbi:hypothetical protein BC830DRAFT_1171817 [Chytriomyces sp. MP71]|nr:hypothetical protein BC830DRAFT_1171817 [Chytriomyces sp. MP71]